MEIKTILAEKRGKGSKRALKECRSSGYIPATLYGGGQQPECIKVYAKEFEALCKEEAALMVRLKMQEGWALSIIKEVQRDPIKRKIIHVDFQRVREDEKIKVDVPIRVSTLERPGIIVEHFLHKLSVQCLPSAIPEHVDIDISSFEPGERLYVKDVDVEGVKILNDPSQLIVAITKIAPEEEEEKEKEEEVEETKENV
jgi:large subunit ribosomal protein L25